MASLVRRTTRGSSPAAQGGSSPVAESGGSRIGWAELPQDLMRDIAGRVAASEGSWPRMSTVACAGVCREWRLRVEEVARVPEGSGMVALLLSSEPPAKLVCDVLEHAMGDPEGKVMNDVAKVADGLVMSLAAQISKMTSDLTSMGASVENALLLIFQFENKRLSRAVKKATFELLINKLFLGILDERLTRAWSKMQHRGSLNDLLLTILDNVDRTSSYVVLINLLRPSKRPSLAVTQKFHELVIQCLMRFTSVIKSTIHSVDLDSILHSIHKYLQELGMRRIRRRAAIGYRPLEMVLSFLHELIKLLGTAIKGHLSRIPRGMQPRPIILVYIIRYLKKSAASRRLLGLPTSEHGPPWW